MSRAKMQQSSVTGLASCYPGSAGGIRADTRGGRQRTEAHAEAPTGGSPDRDSDCPGTFSAGEGTRSVSSKTSDGLEPHPVTTDGRHRDEEHR